MCEFEQQASGASSPGRKAANAVPSVRILDEANEDCKLVRIPEIRFLWRRQNLLTSAEVLHRLFRPLFAVISEPQKGFEPNVSFLCSVMRWLIRNKTSSESKLYRLFVVDSDPPISIKTYPHPPPDIRPWCNSRHPIPDTTLPRPFLPVRPGDAWGSPRVHADSYFHPRTARSRAASG